MTCAAAECWVSKVACRLAASGVSNYKPRADIALGVGHTVRYRACIVGGRPADSEGNAQMFAADADGELDLP
jgi:hypothetical protein